MNNNYVKKADFTYGNMHITVEAKSCDGKNYEVRIMDTTVTYDTDFKKKGKDIVTVYLDISNPQSLVVPNIGYQDEKSRAMISGIIREALAITFSSDNVNMDTSELTTTRELSQKRALLLAQKRFNGHATMPKVINW